LIEPLVCEPPADGRWRDRDGRGAAPGRRRVQVLAGQGSFEHDLVGWCCGACGNDEERSEGDRESDPDTHGAVDRPTARELPSNLWADAAEARATLGRQSGTLARFTHEHVASADFQRELTIFPPGHGRSSVRPSLVWAFGMGADLPELILEDAPAWGAW